MPRPSRVRAGCGGAPQGGPVPSDGRLQHEAAAIRSWWFTCTRERRSNCSMACRLGSRCMRSPSRVHVAPDASADRKRRGRPASFRRERRGGAMMIPVMRVRLAADEQREAFRAPAQVPIVVSGGRISRLSGTDAGVRRLRASGDAMSAPGVGGPDWRRASRVPMPLRTGPQRCARHRRAPRPGGEVEDSSSWFRAANAFAFTSWEEGFGTELGEVLRRGPADRHAQHREHHELHRPMKPRARGRARHVPPAVPARARGVGEVMRRWSAAPTGRRAWR